MKVPNQRMGRTFNLVFWNVRGLGDHTKCDNVLAELLSANPSIVLLQETKLTSPTPTKIRSFLSLCLNSHCILDGDGSRGGILTAWT